MSAHPVVVACGHSACVQNHIDTGERRCLQAPRAPSTGDIGRARKAGPCENRHAARNGRAPWCRQEIQPGEEFAYGDLQPDKAGGFGRSRKCAACLDHEKAISRFADFSSLTGMTREQEGLETFERG